MATVDKYIIDVDVNGKQSVDSLKQSVVGLGSAIAGIGFASFIRGAMEFADSIDDLAKATGLSTERVLAFQNAVSVAGGKSADAGKMISTFYNTMENAASGSEQAQDALQKLGVTLGDLKTKSEQQLLDEAVKGLSKMEAGAGRAAAAQEVFGKAVRNIDPKQLQEALNTGNFESAAAAIEKAAEANEKLEKTFFNLKIATLQVLEPFLGDLDNAEASIESLKKVVTVLGGVIAATFAYKTATVIGEIVVAVVALTNAMRGATVASVALQALAGPGGWIKIGAGIAAAAAATLAMNKMLDDTADKKEDAAKATDKDRKAGKAAFADAQQFSKQEQQARAQAIASAKEQTRVMGEQNKLANDYRQTIISTMGMDANRAALIQANAAAEKDANTQILEIDKKIVEEKAKGRGTNQEVIKQLEEQKNKITEQVGEAKRLNDEEYKRKVLIAEQIRDAAYFTELTKDDIMVYKEKYSLMAKASTFENQILAKRNEVEAQYNSTIASSVIKLQQLSKTPLFDDGWQINKQTKELHDAIEELKSLPTTEAMVFLPRKDYKNADEEQKADKDRKKLIKDMLDAEEAARDKIRNLTKGDNRQEVNDLLTIIDIERNRHSKNMAAITSEEAAIKKKNASMVEGTTQAYEQIRQGMTPFMMAQNATNAVWGRMSSAIDNFVDTGKLAFGDLAQSIIRDLIKIELKAQAMEIWGMLRGGASGVGGGGGGSILGSVGGWLAGLMGFADGGQPPMGKASIVGERGPELFVPRSAGTIIPNHALAGAGGGTQQIVNNNTYITNNVSALDAQSVSQLFAQNRRELFGVVEMARREMPGR